MFFSEFSDHMEQLLVYPGQLIIIGDINFQLDNELNSDTLHFNRMLNCFGLRQHVTFSTHTSGHLLDVVITRENDRLLLGNPVADTYISDHVSILCDLFLQKQTALKQEITFRRVRNIDLLFFNHDLSQALVAFDVHQVNETLFANVNSAFESILDKHAPVVKRKFTVRPKQPWFSPTIVQAKRKSDVVSVVGGKQNWKSTIRFSKTPEICIMLL